jgi:uncharacterized protein
MLHRLIPNAVLVAALLFAAPVLAGEEKTRVVYHMNQGDPALHLMAMRNVQNHINAVGADNLEIKVVMHGPGLNLLTGAKDNADLAGAVDELKMQGVEFQVCRNTLTVRNIQLDALYDATEADIVDSGVAQLSILQRQGYTYIKP